jgi:hypothetical protein
MMLALLRHPLARLRSARLRLLPALGWALLALGGAAATRLGASGHAVDHAVRGTFGPLLLPLLALACVGLICPEARLDEGARSLVLLGAPRRRSALAMGLAVMGLAAASAGVIGALVVAVAHGPADAPLLADLLSTAGVSALGAAAYASYFMMGSAYLGRAGGGILFVVDFLAGSLGVGALLTPRGHLRALLGGPLAAHLAPRVSSVLLAVLALVFLAIASSRRAR